MREAREYCRGLGDAVLKARKEQKITQEYIADHLDINVRTLQKIEHYEGNPTLEILYSLIRLLHIDPRDCFYPGPTDNEPARQKMQALLATCSEDEISFLLQLFGQTIETLRNGNLNTDQNKE